VPDPDTDANRSPLGSELTANAGILRVPLRGLAIASVALALACLAALAVIASIKKAETLATVALALAVVTFVAQLIVFVVQASAANSQMLQARALHTQLLKLLGEMGERQKGTDAAVARIDEQLLEVALGKTLGDGDKTGADARAIATETAALINTRAVSPENRPNVEGQLPAIEIHDEAAHTSAEARLSAVPEADLDAVFKVLEDLPAGAKNALLDYARDEIRYTGTNYATGMPPYSPERQELVAQRLIDARHASLATLTDLGRDAAAVLMTKEAPPRAYAARLDKLRPDSI
jgi:hypothetical protein